MNLSYALILFLLLYIFICHFNQNSLLSELKKEHFPGNEKENIERDIYNSIFNIYNPYTVNIPSSTVSDIMKNKCYVIKYKYDYMSIKS